MSYCPNCEKEVETTGSKYSDLELDCVYYDLHLTVCVECSRVIDSETWVE